MLTSSSRGSIKVTADRAAITSANTTVGAGRSQGTSLVPGARMPGIFGLPERSLTIRDLVLPGQTSSSSIEYVKETGYTNNAAPVAETTAKPYSDLTFDMTSAPVRTIAHLFKASRQILDDAPALRSYIDGRARYGLRFAEENQLLNGSGTGQNIHGLVPQATAFSPAFTLPGATGIDRLRLAILQVVLAEYPAAAFVLNPIDWTKIELTKDAGGNYIIGNPQGSLTPTLWNLPVVSTQAMAAGEFLTGAFSFAAQIFDRLDIEVLLSSENVDDFEKNMFTIRAEERLAFAVYRPESFVTGDVEGAQWGTGASAPLFQIGENMTDFLEVKAIKTFALRKDLKTRKSPSFEVEAGEARQLEAQGLVSLAGKIEVIKEPDGGASDSGTKPKQKAKSDGSIDKDA